jgi:hypothetical protein
VTGRHRKGDAPGTMLAIMLTCNLHVRHPEPGCGRCEHAINCNRVNHGWGIRYDTTPEGFTVTWQVYEPRLSWFGPDAFMGVTLREGWEG